MLHQLLKADLQAAVEEGVLAVNPGATVEPPSKKLAEEAARSMKPYSAEEAAEALRRIKSSRYHTFIATLGSVGARRSECGCTDLGPGRPREQGCAYRPGLAPGGFRTDQDRAQPHGRAR
jgi:hypothetical protein